MTEANQCFVTECTRGALASVTRPDLPGPLRLCATHTEQFRQSSEGWGITWASGAPAPAAVTAPSSDVLWAYRREPGTGPPPAPPAADPARRGRGLSGRAAGWIESRRGGKHDGGPK